jgi:hypothetical protein
MLSEMMTQSLEKSFTDLHFEKISSKTISAIHKYPHDLNQIISY